MIAAKCSVVTRFRDTIGLPGRLAVRLQPNHPTDDLRAIAASILDGLLLGAGDAVIGINPATDSTERAHALLARRRRDAGELIAAARRRRFRQQRLEVAEDVAAARDGRAVHAVLGGRRA